MYIFLQDLSSVFRLCPNHTFDLWFLQDLGCRFTMAISFSMTPQEDHLRFPQQNMGHSKFQHQTMYNYCGKIPQNYHTFQIQVWSLPKTNLGYLMTLNFYDCSTGPPIGKRRQDSSNHQLYAPLMTRLVESDTPRCGAATGHVRNITLYNMQKPMFQKP